MTSGIRGKNALVVGASKGIGRAISLALAKEGAVVTAVARSEPHLITLLTEMNAVTPVAHAIFPHDLMNGDIFGFAQMLTEERGSFNIVVHNVGGSLTSRDPLGGWDEWSYALTFNAGIAIEMNRALIPPMEKNGWGRVVHISSISAVMLRGNPQYASAKAFLNAYVTTVGRALAPTCVVLTAIMPGAIAFDGSYWDLRQNDIEPHEDGTRRGIDICREFLSQHQAAARFGTPEEIANIVAFLVSDAASFMPGACIDAGGGNM
ncbi:3-oxoacyl-ACP reductase [Clostridia bacterium]|nr:3-oxoacyl-ACP reductase [Clostridia bacterium]